jgi:hypothetical protein
VLLHIPYAELCPSFRPTELLRLRSPPQPAQHGPSVRKLLTTNCCPLARTVRRLPAVEAASCELSAVGC